MCASGYLLSDAVCIFVCSSVVVHWPDLQCPDPGNHLKFVAGVVEAGLSWAHHDQQIRRAAQTVRVATEEFCLWMLQQWLAGVSATAWSVFLS
jgi:hypothetical protein